MSEYNADNYHRRETSLAEFSFYVGDKNEEAAEDIANYVSLYCSRVMIRDTYTKSYYINKVTARKENPNFCSEDDFEECHYLSLHHPMKRRLNAIQPSDSGADLTYEDNSDKLDKNENIDQALALIGTKENYKSADTFDKFWAQNGERLIWASWIKKYSDYINPAYLDENNGLIMDENNIPKQHSVDQICIKTSSSASKTIDNEIRERKFSYDSKVNPYKKTIVSPVQNQQEKSNKNEGEPNKDDTWIPIARRRSFSEQDRIVSPRTLAGTDSMTNVTKLTLSSYDITSSHVTSDSTPTDVDDVSSTTSDDPSNDQTIANVVDRDEYSDEIASQEIDSEHYWQFLWKKHFGEQYALHLAKYSEEHIIPKTEGHEIKIVKAAEQQVINKEKPIDIDHKNSEGSSLETPTVIEIQNQVDEISLDDNAKTKKRNKKPSSRYINSVGVLLQSLLKNDTIDLNEPVNAGDDHNNKGDTETEDKHDAIVKEAYTSQTPNNQSSNNSDVNSCDDDNNDYDNSHDDETPEDNGHDYEEDDNCHDNENCDDDDSSEDGCTLKRGHELDDEDRGKVKNALEMMGFCVNAENLPYGQTLFIENYETIRPPKYMRFATGKKTYFDEDGNPYTVDPSAKREQNIQTDNDCVEAKLDTDKANATDTAEDEYEFINLPISDEYDKLADTVNVSQPEDDDDEEKEKSDELEKSPANHRMTSKRKRKIKRKVKVEQDDRAVMPDELKDDPKMFKYWKKRHSLFHRFDEGIKLDHESWFSVTPEAVAVHIACKFRYNVVLDAFCGAGGNTIQFAFVCKKVIAIDIDPQKIELARHNAEVYKVAHRIEFIVGDFFELAPKLKADMVFLSPPWGGPSYSENEIYDLETMLEPRPASQLITVARTISPNITFYIPRNSRPDQILQLGKGIGGAVEVEQSYLNKRFVAITVYFYQM